MELDLQTSHGIATGIGIDVKTEHMNGGSNGTCRRNQLRGQLVMHWPQNDIMHGLGLPLIDLYERKFQEPATQEYFAFMIWSLSHTKWLQWCQEVQYFLSSQQLFR